MWSIISSIFPYAIAFDTLLITALGGLLVTQWSCYIGLKD